MNSRTSTLRGEDSSWCQFLHASLVEWVGVKLVARTTLKWVWKIHYDYVKIPICALFESLFRIIDNQLRPWVFERSSRVFRHMLPAHFDHISINIDHHTLFNGLMFKHLPQSSSFTPAANKHSFRDTLHDHGWLHEALMINMLINFCRLKKPISHEALPVSLRLVHSNLLKFRGALIMGLFILHRVIKTVVQFLVVPKAILKSFWSVWSCHNDLLYLKCLVSIW